MPAGAPEAAAGEAFLGVERSLGGRRWRSRLVDARAGLALAQQLGLPEIVGRLLAARGVGADEAAGFLNPRLQDQLPDPSSFQDMDRAVARLVRAIRDGERIAVFGDYDVDGATSAALLRRFLAAIGVPLIVYIPDRLAEGYGPNLPALLRLREQGVAVVITVDCGTTAFEPLAGAAEAGLDVIVVDHHVAEHHLPRAVALINPNRADEREAIRREHGQLAAVGVAFLLVVALNRALREAGWYSTARPEPDLRRWLDLVALGTVCDVVPLTGVNRALVSQGLAVMARRGNQGLAALADVAGLGERPSAYHVGFMLGPRVNAGGRIGAADLGSRLLSTDDPGEAQSLARQLDVLNAERRTIEQSTLDAAMAQLDADGETDGSIAFVSGEGWHAGVIGIVAARLKARYNRPACVVALAGGIGKGSGRSIPGVDLGSAIVAARQAGLLINGGGHRMAAGFTVEARQLDGLRRFLAARIGDTVRTAQLVPTLNLDGLIDPAAATPELVALVQQLGPFGSGNAEPRFAIAGARVLRADTVGHDHVRCFVAGGDGGRLKAIAFRSADGPVGRALLNSRGATLHLAGHLRADNWQGREQVQLLIDDAAPATFL